MEKIIEPKALYRTGQIPIPTPEFFVFYNGDQDFPEEKILKLSDAYLEKAEKPMLELIVRVININLPVNHPILDQCRPLYEYAWFIQKIKDYMIIGKNRDEAIVHAMAECRQEEILVDFLREHGTEAVNMLFTEFNMEDALEVRFEEGKAEGKVEGKAEGKAECILEILQELHAETGQLPDAIKQKILSEGNLEVLNCWLRHAAKAESIDQFVSYMESDMKKD